MDIQGPYDGKMIEKATSKEYQEGFDCIKGNRKLKKSTIQTMYFKMPTPKNIFMNF